MRVRRGHGGSGDDAGQGGPGDGPGEEREPARVAEQPARPPIRLRGHEPAGDGTTATATAATGSAVFEIDEPPPLLDRPLVRGGVYAWCLIGVGLVVIAAIMVLGLLSVVVVPLLLALFPAAVLAPPARRLRSLGLPAAAAAGVTLLGFVAAMALFFTLLAPSVANELGDLGERLTEGYGRARDFLEAGPFGMDPVPVGQVVERIRERLTEGDLAQRLGEYAIAVAEGFAGLVLGLLALFFYLKDGERMGAWLRDLFPLRFRADAVALGERVWGTIGSYIRGQLLIALVDGVFIGLGLLVLRVPLVLPLAVLTFFGGLFPIVGAFTAGAVAVLVALATGGLAKALAVLALIVAVQQLESHLLAPIVLGRATQLHPLAVIAALAAGGVLLGVLGAFIAVPLAASAARAVGYVRQRVPG